MDKACEEKRKVEDGEKEADAFIDVVAQAS
jgi:hypothetical protein